MNWIAAVTTPSIVVFCLMNRSSHDPRFPTIDSLPMGRPTVNGRSEKTIN